MEREIFIIWIRNSNYGNEWEVLRVENTLETAKKIVGYKNGSFFRITQESVLDPVYMDMKGEK